MIEPTSPQRPLRPDLAEVKRVCLKRHDSFRGRVFYRRISIPITWWLVRTKVSANAVTYASLVAGLVALGLWLTQGPWWTVLGVVLLHLAMVLDHVDGEVARWRGGGTLGGLFLDKMVMDVWVQLALFFVLSILAFFQTRDVRWAAVGTTLAFAKAVSVSGFGVREALTERFRSTRGSELARDVPRNATLKVFRYVASHYWEVMKTITTASLVVLLDAAWQAAGYAVAVIRGLPVTFTCLFVAGGAVILLVSIALDLVKGTRQPALAELDPFR